MQKLLLFLWVRFRCGLLKASDDFVAKLDGVADRLYGNRVGTQSGYGFEIRIPSRKRAPDN
jgi:hypothetical protein